ncbi:MAG: flagellar hook-length control protein FliK [Gammaproteobacteria bacterium]
MRIDLLNLPITQLTVESKPFLKSLQVGQTLLALVLGRTEQDLLELRIGAQKVTAATSQFPNSGATARTIRSLHPGEGVKLIVLENQDTLVLQILDKPDRQTAKPLLQQLLRHSLPRHGTPATLFKNLIPAKLLGAASARQLPEAVVKQIIESMTAFPGKQAITTVQGLKQAIENSGLFLEARLQALLQEETSAGPAREMLRQDFKAVLLRLKQTVEQNLFIKEQPLTELKEQPVTGKKTVRSVTHKSIGMPVQQQDIPDLVNLRKAIDSSIARIQMHQASAIVSDGSQAPLWMIDIPIHEGQRTSMAQLKISYREQSENGQEKQRKWSVTLSLDIEPLGIIHARIAILAETVSSSIWAENDFTYHLIDQHLEQLTARLQQAGVNIDCINCYPGAMRASDQINHKNQGLVSVRI